jgi:ribosomal protein L37AE/L43A
MAIVRVCSKCGVDMAASLYGMGPSGPHVCGVGPKVPTGGYPEPKRQSIKCDGCGIDVKYGRIENGLVSCPECK